MNTITPYDDVFRTLLNDCTSLIIPVINEMFGEHYNGNERIEFLPNEHFLNRPDGEEEKRITDSNFRIIALESKKYHLESQSTPDNSMLIRMFEYDTQIALDDGELEGALLKVTFPRSAVLFLRYDKNTPEEMSIRMETPGGAVRYQIPVMKVQRYSLEEIFEKKLLFLLPFHIFRYEKELGECENDEKKLKLLQAEFMRIRNYLDEQVESGTIDEYVRATIIDMSNRVLAGIARKYENVRKGVKDVMGGNVLEYEAKTIRNEGLREGRREGRREGTLETLISLVHDGILSEEIAAEKANMPISEFRAVYQKKCAMRTSGRE